MHASHLLPFAANRAAVIRALPRDTDATNSSLARLVAPPTFAVQVQEDWSR